MADKSLFTGQLRLALLGTSRGQELVCSQFNPKYPAGQQPENWASASRGLHGGYGVGELC